MKPKASLRSFLAALGGSILAISSASAATLYWDGADSGANAQGGAGSGANSWTTTTPTNWDTLASGGTDIGWTSGDIAVFGGTAGTVDIGAGGVTVGGLVFNTSAYVINAGSNGLTFSTGTNNIRLSAGLNGSPTATITGKVDGGSGANVNLVGNPGATGTTLTFNGTSSTGWQGTTTINSGATMALAASSQALVNTSAVSGPAITLNGGGITLTNTATGSENTIDRINDTATIASYGSTSISIANTATASRAYTETIGSITHNNGQLSLGFATNQNQSSNTQTLNVGGALGLTVNGSTSTVAINGGGSGASNISANSNIYINGITTSTSAGEIVGPWMTAGTILGAQSDWAVYTSDGVKARVSSRANPTATAQTSWTSSSATGNFLAAAPNPTTSPVNHKLTANREVNTLRATFAETGSSSGANWAWDTANDKITFTVTHALADGDVVHFRTSPTGISDNRPYYVINSTPTSIQLSTTPGGVTPVDITATANSFMSTGINLNGNTLALNGYVTGTTGTASIGGGSASTITLPSNTTPGNLYLHGASGLWIDPSIKDNGAGVLTLVKSGTFTLGLSGNNTYSGGTVINGGTINFATAGSWVSGQNLTFGGTGAITASVGALSGGTLNVDQGATGTITGTSGITFSSTSGSGQIIYGGGSSATLALGNASGFTGNAVLSIGIGGTNPYPTLSFTNIADTAGSYIGWGAAGQGDSNQKAFISLIGNPGSTLTFDNRQIAILGRTSSSNTAKSAVLLNNRTTGSNAWVINTDLINNADRTNVGFILDGSNADNNTFAGDIGNSTIGAYAALNVYKNGGGKWILSGDNTFTGRLIAGQGTLSVGTFNESSAAGPLGKGTVIQLGGDERAVAGTATNVILTSNNSGTLEYTGGTVTSTRTGFLIGDTNATGTGGGTIANNGTTGAMTFSAPTFNSTQALITATRTLTLAGSNTNNNEIQGTIQDNVLSTGKINLAKSGDGTWALSGTNTYTGTTTVNSGTLLVNSPGSLDANSAVTVNGGTLGGTGTINGSVTVAAAGSLAPGASAGTLTFTGALNISAQVNGGSGRLKFQLGANTAGSDQIAITGAGTLTTGGKLGFSDFTFTSLPGGPQNVAYTLITTGSDPTALLDGADLSGPIGVGGTGTLSASGNDIILTVTGLGGGSAYDTWKAANAPGSNPDDDTDGDGVSNAVEFVLGGTSATKDLDKLPQVATDGTNMTFSFKRKQSSIDPKTSLAIEVGTDLVGWTTGASPYIVPDGVTAGPPVKVEKGVPVDFDTVTLTVAQDSAKKFARLKVVITP